MSKGLRVWLNSGANAFSNYEQVLTWDDLGFPESEWDEMTEDEKESLARDIAFERSDWGFTVTD